MTSRERLKRVFNRQDTDRMPVRIWGVDPMFPRDDWKDLYEWTEKYELDIIRSWHPDKEETTPLPYEIHSEETIIEEKGIKEIRTVIETPLGPLAEIRYQPVDGSPGYVKKHLIEDVSDAKKFLSLPEQKDFPGTDSYFTLEKKTGQRAMLMVGIDEALYAVQRKMGSEKFGYWLYDERDLVRQMVDKEYKNLEALVKHYLSKNIGDCFGWVGPELCIPPLTSVKDFYEFIVGYDKRHIELIHNAGKPVWIHCHGDMKPVLEGFIEMGTDCLNPIEPPPVGSITLAEAKAVCSGRMALEGGVEDGAIDTLKPDAMEALVADVINQGKPGGGFILCPTSSPTTRAKLLPHQIENYRVFVETAVKMRYY